MSLLQTLPEYLLRTSRLTIGYTEGKNTRILQKEQSLQLYEGDLVCLIGPNGCGKSTLIRTLAGLQLPLSGSAEVMGKPIDTLSIAERSRLIGTVLTDRAAVDHISVEEIVALGRYNFTNWLGILGADDQLKVDQALAHVGMSHLRHHYYATLSDGEKQRAFIAKVLAADTPILLLDEPTAHLDLPNRVEILTLLRTLTRTSGHAVLVSTHDLDLALKLADEIWLMMPDRKMVCGTPEEIGSGQYLDQVFGNELIAYSRKSGGFKLKTHVRQSVCVEGDSEHAHTGRLAFRRLGFSVEGEGEPVARISVKKNVWSVAHGGNRAENLKLSQVCRMLRKLERINTLEGINKRNK